MTQRNLSSALALLGKLQSALQRGERAPVIDLLRQLVAMRAPLGTQWIQLSQIAAANGEIGLAKAVIELYVEAAQNDPAASYMKVALLTYVGEWQAAYELLLNRPQDVPDGATYAYTRGTAALYLGKYDEAREFLERAIQLKPLACSPWLALSMMVDFSRDTELAGRLIASEGAVASAPVGEQAIYYNALGKARADRGEHKMAFDAYAHSARLLKPMAAYSRERDRFTATDAVSGYDAKQIAALARRQTEPTGRTIFVMGLPRSGTTLIEQILTSHSAVFEGGELYLIGLLVKDIGGLSLPALRQYVEVGNAPAAARLWDHWLGERFSGSGRIVDKTLNASRMMGYIATLLPEAPAIWLTRDPLDCAWSCFRTRFSGEAWWSYDLEDIAYHFRLEDELLERWQAILGERLLVVPYEQLATYPEPWIRRILAHCGLAEEPQVFAPHENARPVKTASVVQVRQPINRSGIGSAEPYREFLEPFVEAYRS